MGIIKVVRDVLMFMLRTYYHTLIEHNKSGVPHDSLAFVLGLNNEIKRLIID